MIKKSSSGKTKIFVVSAPSGCGKTTLCDKLLADRPDLANSVSMTTRLPRPGETKGKDYIFVSKRRFLDMVKRNAFIEHEENFGNLYGTPTKFVEQNLAVGKPVLLSIDVKGAMKIRRRYPKESVLIFILPPSLKALKERLKKRRSETPEAMMRRLSLAKKEIEYSGKYDHRIVNDTLDKAFRNLKDIVKTELEGSKNA